MRSCYPWPRWSSGSGPRATAAGCRHHADRAGCPDGLVGVGFALGVTSITTVAVNTVPVHYAGMAGAATSLSQALSTWLRRAVLSP
jgi:hypothetical protein